MNSDLTSRSSPVTYLLASLAIGLLSLGLLNFLSVLFGVNPSGRVAEPASDFADAENPYAGMQAG